MKKLKSPKWGFFIVFKHLKDKTNALIGKIRAVAKCIFKPEISKVFKSKYLKAFLLF
jgi:hypothetical protein